MNLYTLPDGRVIALDLISKIDTPVEGVTDSSFKIEFMLNAPPAYVYVSYYGTPTTNIDKYNELAKSYMNETINVHRNALIEAWEKIKA